MQAQEKSTKMTWFSIPGGGSRVKFACEQKRLADGEELNMLVTQGVANALKLTKRKIRTMTMTRVTGQNSSILKAWTSE